MERIKTLVSGEFSRLAKYNLFIASTVVALIWVGLGVFLDQEEMRMLLPFAFLLEASAMTALLVGAEMFYEKKEHTISSMIISPMTDVDYLLSKVLTHLLNILFIFVVISGGLYIVNGLVFNYGWLLLATVIVTIFYVGVGLVLSYLSKDFTALLMNYMLMMLLLVIPSVLLLAGIIPSSYADLLTYLPSEITIRLLSSATISVVDVGQFFLDAFIVLVASLLLFRLIVLPFFKKFATENLGV